MSRSSRRSAEAHFKQLCLSGVEGKLLMPALEKLLRELVPSSNMSFVWIDGNGRVVDGYMAYPVSPELVSFLVGGDFLDCWKSELGISILQSLQQPKPVVQLEEVLKVDRRTFERHELYENFCRPIGWHWSLHATVGSSEQPIGGLSLTRARGERDFTDAEKQVLARIVPFLEHALSVPVDYHGPWMDSGELGLLILDQHGTLCHASPEAKRLLCYADYSMPSSWAAKNPGTTGLKDSLKRMCQYLREGGKDERSGPPVVHHQNAWGTFVFRAHWLDPCGQENDAFIGITVQRQEPLPLKLLRALKDSALSSRERQVCLLISLGFSYPEIANKLSVAKRTVVTHSQNIFNKLGVINRTEMTNLLLAQSAVSHSRPGRSAV